MKQHEQVMEAMRRLGGYATLGMLNQQVDVGGWGTKTPFATIRRIVQDDRFFFRIRPGLWALKEAKAMVLDRLGLGKGSASSSSGSAPEEFDHYYYQGLLLEVGRLKGLETYVPPQDGNRLFLEKPLKTVATVSRIYDFTWPELVARARTVDVIWFNERRLPNAFFEVEHSTDIQNSLLKFMDLRYFHSEFTIVAAEARHKEFAQKLGYDAFREIQPRVVFLTYEKLATQYELLVKLKAAEGGR